MTIQTINIGTTPNDNTGDDPRTAGQKLNSNFTTSTHAASRDVGTASGNVMEVGAGGLLSNSIEIATDLNAIRTTKFLRLEATTTGGPLTEQGYALHVERNIASGLNRATQDFHYVSGRKFTRTRDSGDAWSTPIELFTSGNLNPNVFGGVAGTDLISEGYAENATAAVFDLPISLPSPPSSFTQSGTFTVKKAAGFATVAVGLTISSLAGTTSNKYAVLVINSGLAAMTAGEKLLLVSDSGASKITVNP